MPVLATWAPEDGILGAVAPLGLAAALPTALVVDLDPAGPRYWGPATLRRLVDEGPRRSDLEPQRSGLAVLPNGGVPLHEAADVVVALAERWPGVVLRLPARGPTADLPLRVPYAVLRPLLPGGWSGEVDGPVVWQSTGLRLLPPQPGPVLPRARPAVVAALLRGTRPRRDRWVAALGRLWSGQWG